MDSEKKDELTQTASVSEGKAVPHYAPEPSSPNDTIIQNAIETIGMGRYQWQLLASCGFGFIADQVGPARATDKLAIVLTGFPDAARLHQPSHATGVQGVLAAVCHAAARNSIRSARRWGRGVWLFGGYLWPAVGVAGVDLWGFGLYGCVCWLAELGGSECVYCAGGVFWWGEL